MYFRQISDEILAQYAYLIGCQRTGEAIVVDPERDIDRYLEAAASAGLRITAVAETHIHADFVSGARELAERTGAALFLSAEGGPDWQSEWAADSDYDVTLLRDGDVFRVGFIEFRAVHTPGHTPEHMSYLVTDHGGGSDEPMGVITGDFVFVGDLGRPDLLESAAKVQGAREPSARRLYASLSRFLELEDYVQVWPGHGAGSACGKDLGAVPQSTVGYERRHNAALDVAERGEGPFVEAILTGQPEPPMYFARMKRENRAGPRLLGRLPEPRRIEASELGDIVAREDAVILDTRRGAAAFLDVHLPGSIHAPLNERFALSAGVLVGEDDPIYLVAADDEVEDAVRALVRMGYDRIEGAFPWSAAAEYLAAGGEPGHIRRIDLDELAAGIESGDARPLDVRYASEFDAGHMLGATHVPLTRLPEHRDRVPSGGEVQVYCRSGARAAIASSYLAREGVPVACVVDSWDHSRVRHEKLPSGSGGSVAA